MFLTQDEPEGCARGSRRSVRQGSLYQDSVRALKGGANRVRGEQVELYRQTLGLDNLPPAVARARAEAEHEGQSAIGLDVHGSDGNMEHVNVPLDEIGDLLASPQRYVRRYSEDRPQFSRTLDETGPRGPVFRQFLHDERGATEALESAQTGEALAVLEEKAFGYGDVDLVWGYEGIAAPEWDKGFGLAHILVKHPTCGAIFRRCSTA